MRLKLTFGIIIIFAIAVFNWQGNSFAQVRNQTQDLSGKVNGIVKDVHDAAVPWAAIMFENKVSGKKFKRRVESNGDGVYEIELPAGIYRVEVKFSGFRKFQHKDLVVEGDKTTRFDIVLKENPRSSTSVTD